MAKRKLNNKTDKLWAEVKRRCSLSAEDVRMAKDMGLNPRSLIKNIPNKSQPWKAPVREWIRNMYGKRLAKTTSKKARKGPKPNGGGQ